MAPIYAALQTWTPAPALSSIPNDLSSTCDPTVLNQPTDSPSTEQGNIHYMLGQLYAWRLVRSVDGSLCAVLDLPSAKVLTRNDLQVLETVSLLKAPFRSIKGEDVNVTPTTSLQNLSTDFVREFSSTSCELNGPVTGNLVSIAPQVAITTQALAQNMIDTGCVAARSKDGLRDYIDIVRVGLGAASTGNAALAFLELQEPTLNAPIALATSGANAPAVGSSGSALQIVAGFPIANFGSFQTNTSLRSLIQANAAPGCPGLGTPHPRTGGSLLNNTLSVVGLISGTSAECRPGSGFNPPAGFHDFAAVKFQNAEYAKLLIWANNVSRNNAVGVASPRMDTTFSVESLRLTCSNSTLNPADVRWESSRLGVTGSPVIGTGCDVPTDNLARGTQTITAYRISAPAWKSSVRVDVLRPEGTLTLPVPDQFFLPPGNVGAEKTLSWTSIDTGNEVFVTRTVDNGAEQIIANQASGQMAVTLSENRTYRFSLREARPGGQLTGKILATRLIGVYPAEIQKPAWVSYPFTQLFFSYSPNCLAGLCTTEFRWQANAGPNGYYDMQFRTIPDCPTVNCNVAPFQSLGTVAQSRKVHQFALSNNYRIEFRVRTCTEMHVCSSWTAPVSDRAQTNVFGTINVVMPVTRTWEAAPELGWNSCDEVPPINRPKMIVQHNCPWPQFLYSGVKIVPTTATEPAEVVLMPDTTYEVYFARRLPFPFEERIGLRGPCDYRSLSTVEFKITRTPGNVSTGQPTQCEIAWIVK